MINRRELLTGLGAAAAAAALPDLHAAGDAPAPAALPCKADFAFEKGHTYINGAFTHPMPIPAADAYRDAIRRRATVGAPGTPADPSRVDPRTAFAALINAKPSEISYVPN